MRKIFLISAVLISITACIPFLPPFSPDENGRISISGRNYELVWAEEFDYNGLPNPSRWRFETGYVRNDEVQYYTDARPGNCWVSNGKLQITARNDSVDGHPVTSASIETQDLYEFRYGFVQVRAKMPHPGWGTWPAIWTLGANSDVPGSGWPVCGEIDIMEWTGRTPNVILGSTFLPGYNGDPISRNFPYILLTPDIATEEFHDYAIEWDSENIRYYMDGVNYVTYTRNNIGGFSWTPLTLPHYLKLNLAMGGFIPPIGGGGPIDYSGFPYTFEVEYVRHYERVN